MSYLVLARKYRPQSFNDLVGQDHVARTLANAIAQDRVAHAFLFTGVRGVGKTSSARLLAKCLNCLGKDGKAKGPTSDPCQTCAACTEIAAGMDLDVQEIDGASYNGVDEVRKLQETLAFRPARDRYKIYIVDEVHMLSNAAWNAFLKTLEEPPPHVKFIFATTEVHKVPVTILSRCQRYDFRLIPAKTVMDRLAAVLAQEKIKSTEGALSILAREAAGSMRDAMSLMDQVLAYKSDSFDESDVARVLGVTDFATLMKLAKNVLTADAANALLDLGKALDQGVDPLQLAKEFLTFLRHLVVLSVADDRAAELVEVSPDELASARALAKGHSTDDLSRLFLAMSKSFDDIARGGHPRLAFEMLLVRLAKRPPLVPIAELVERLAHIEAGGGGTSPRGPSPGGGGGGGGGRASGPGGAGQGGGTRHAPAQNRPAPKASLSAAPALFVPPPLPTPGSSESHVRSNTSAGRSDTRMRLVPTKTQPDYKFEAPAFQGNLALAHDPDPSENTPAPASADMPLSLPVPDDATLTAWRAIIEVIRTERPQLAAVLEHASAPEVSAKRVGIAFTKSEFLGHHFEDPEALAAVSSAAKSHFGGPVVIDLTLDAPSDSLTASLAQIAREEERLAAARMRAAVESHPLVRFAITELGAELREIRLPKPAH